MWLTLIYTPLFYSVLIFHVRFAEVICMYNQLILGQSAIVGTSRVIMMIIIII